MVYSPDQHPRLPEGMSWLNSRVLQEEVACSLSRDFNLEFDIANSISEKIVIKLEEIAKILQRHPNKIFDVLNSISSENSIEDYYHGMFTKLAKAAKNPLLSGLAKVANRALELKKYEKGYKQLLVEHFRVESASIRRSLSLGIEDSQNKLSEIVSFATNKAMEEFKIILEQALERPDRPDQLGILDKADYPSKPR